MAYITVTTESESFQFNILNNHKEYSLTLWRYTNSATGEKWCSFDAFNFSNIERTNIVIPNSVKQEAIEEFSNNVVFN